MSVRSAWMPPELWQEVEEAEDVLTEAMLDARAEAGGLRERAMELFEARARRPGSRLNEAVVRVTTFEYLMAHALNDGWEPVPGERPGVMQRRPGGPLPLDERRRLAEELGLTLDLIGEDDDDDDERKEHAR